MKTYLLLIYLFLIFPTVFSFNSVAVTAPSSPFANSPSPSLAFRGPFNLQPAGFTRAPAKVYLPLQYSRLQKWPVVILLHGMGATADTEDLYLTMRYRVSNRGFILVTPEGTVMPPGTISPDDHRDVSGEQFWNATDVCCDFGKTQVDDVGYLSKVIETVKQEYQADTRRIYLIGHSNGGFMANRLACEIGGELAGIASLAGGSFLKPEDCRVPTALPFLQIHAINDNSVAYDQHPYYAGGLKTIEQWINKNGCMGPPVNGPDRNFLILIPDTDTADQLWSPCASGKDVALWTIRAYQTNGHDPHIPVFNLSFMEAVLDFLFRQSL